MNLNDCYGGNWLKAADLQGKDWLLTISEVIGKHKFDDGSEQIVIAFSESEKTLGLNWTNASVVADLYGDTDIDQHWVGKKVQVYPTTTDFGKKRNIPCIRIRAFDPTRNPPPPPPTGTMAAPMAPAAPVAPPAPVAPAAPDPTRGDQFIPPAVVPPGPPPPDPAMQPRHVPIPASEIPF